MKMADDTMKKKRGRPPLSDEERELRRSEANKKQAERFKKNGYAAQKKYHSTHPEKERERSAERHKKNRYIKIQISREYEPTLNDVVASTGCTLTDIFLSAVEEKYKIVLRKQVDKTTDK